MQRTSEDFDWATDTIAQAYAANDVLRRELTARDGTIAAVRTALEDAVDSGIRSPPIDDWSGWCQAVLRYVRGEADDLAAEVARSQDSQSPHTRAARKPDGHDPAVKMPVCELCKKQISGSYYRDREPGDDGGDDYHHECWAWLKGKDRGPRPGAVRLSVLPATCGECEHEDGSGMWCNHSDHGYRYASKAPKEAPPTWCPLRQKEG